MHPGVAENSGTGEKARGVHGGGPQITRMLV